MNKPNVMLPNAIIYMDQNNIFHRYKKLDFVKLLAFFKNKYNIIRATSYNAIDTRQEGQRKFVTYMANNGWKCQVIDIVENTNVDNRISADILNDYHVFHGIDTVVLIACDGGFSYPLSLVAARGIKVHVIGVKDNTHLSLLSVADELTYIEDIEGVILTA